MSTTQTHVLKVLQKLKMGECGILSDIKFSKLADYDPVPCSSCQKNLVNGPGVALAPHYSINELVKCYLPQGAQDMPLQAPVISNLLRKKTNKTERLGYNVFMTQSFQGSSVESHAQLLSSNLLEEDLHVNCFLPCAHTKPKPFSNCTAVNCDFFDRPVYSAPNSRSTRSLSLWFGIK